MYRDPIHIYIHVEYPCPVFRYMNGSLCIGQGLTHSQYILCTSIGLLLQLLVIMHIYVYMCIHTRIMMNIHWWIE